MYKPDGTEISKHDMGNSGADVPGDFEYTWKWTLLTTLRHLNM